jgi:hypothetical protein
MWLCFFRERSSRNTTLPKGGTVLKRIPRLAAVAAGIAGVFAAGAQALVPPGQPVASAGPVSSPGGAVTASGTATSGGKADACVNDQHSGAKPSTSQPAQVNDRNCTASSGTASRSSAAGSSSGTQSGSGSTSGARSGTAGTTGSKSGTSGAKKTAAVSASQARGLRITGIRYLTSGVQKTHHLGVLVTLRDELGRPIRGAVVTLGSAPGATPALKARTVPTNALGTARFSVPTTSAMLGKRLQLQVGAHTPTTRMMRLTSVLVPKGTSAPCKK